MARLQDCNLLNGISYIYSIYTINQSRTSNIHHHMCFCWDSAINYVPTMSPLQLNHVSITPQLYLQCISTMTKHRNLSMSHSFVEWNIFCWKIQWKIEWKFFKREREICSRQFPLWDSTSRWGICVPMQTCSVEYFPVVYMLSIENCIVENPIVENWIVGYSNVE